jgi:NADH-quinone oxidoreductase subunit F
MPDFPIVLTNRYRVPQGWTLKALEAGGGYGAYESAKRAFTSMDAAQIQAEVKEANIRGRGGAGFPAGIKWGFLPKDSKVAPYLVINADEGEPGTFKDRTLMELDPHRLIEGCAITMRAIGAHVCYIYVRCELVTSIRRLEAAIEEARARGYLGIRPYGVEHPIHIYVHTGAGAYICGEETALLNSLEGKRGEPRLKPPFPAVKGAFGAPTIVNNVETVASVPDIVRMGGKAWSAQSRLARDGGTRLYGVSGHVKKPGVFEAPVGLTLRELIFDLGGGMLHPDRQLKAVIPGGSSTPVLRPGDIVHAPDANHPLHAWHGKSHIDVPMGVDTFRALGTMLGTCCAIVLDDSTSMVDAARNLMHFYSHESCGQCTPCREGTGWLHDVLKNLCTGKGRPEDVDLLVDIANNMMGNTICAFADGTAMPMLGFLQKFREEFVEAGKRGVPSYTLGATARALGGVA